MRCGVMIDRSDKGFLITTGTRREPNREFRWRGKLTVPGLFNGEHSFQINPIDDDRVEYVQRETFSGILVGMVFGMMGAATQQGFEAMNRARKTQAEGGGSG